nr:retrovirus-related Pol polyprotein from transposon TNT 1-94 [Tanacetum cinerariifolium]
MYVANTTAEARCLALEAELANLCDTNNHDNQKELINHFSKLEVNHLNLQLKYQNLKDSNGNNPPTPNKDTLDFDSVFVTGKMQASLQGKDNVIRQLKKQLCQLQVTHGDIDRTLRVQTTDSHITKLTDHVTHLQAQNGLFRAKNKQHYKELYDSIKITRAKHIKQVTKLTTKNVNLKTCVSKATVNPQVSARDKHAIDVEPIVPHLMKNRDAHLDYLRHLKESVETIRDIVQEAKVVVQIVLWYLDSGCSKHMTGDHSRLMNFIKKFIGTVRFGNDHFGAIMGYGDYVIGNSVISRTVPRTSQQNGVVERRNHTLVEAAQTMLIFFKALMFLWAEAVATACYTQNRSLIHTHHHKTPYEVVHNKKPDLTFFRVFGALCYPTNDSEDLRKLQPTADTGIFVGYAPSRKGYRIYNKRTRRIMETIHVQFDELTEPMAPVHLKPPRAERPVPPAQAEPALVNSAGTPLSNTIDQDAPTPSISPSSSALQSHSLHQGVATEPNYMEERTNAPVDNPPFVNVFAPEPHSKATSSGDISSTDSPYISQTLHHLNK